MRPSVLLLAALLGESAGFFAPSWAGRPAHWRQGQRVTESRAEVHASQGHGEVSSSLSGTYRDERAWEVVIWRDGQRHVLMIPESQSVLSAVEEAGLFPESGCRRGSCLSCAARVVNGASFSLEVGEFTSLCSEAHDEGIVLLCSARARGPGLELELDMDWRAWEIQCHERFQKDAAKDPPPPESRPHFQLNELREQLERSLSEETRSRHGHRK